MKLTNPTRKTTLPRDNRAILENWLVESNLHLGQFGLLRLVAEVMDMQATNREVSLALRVTKSGDSYALYINAGEQGAGVYATDFQDLDAKCTVLVEAPETP